MALGDTAPLVAVAHDWTSPVERVRTYPTAIIGPARDGSEQRQALSDVATDVLTYRLLAPTAVQALAIRTIADSATDAIVRVPRWEDQTRVDTAAASGSAVVVSCDTTDRPTFVVGAQVILWRSADSYEVTTLDAVASDSITVDLTASWAAGTIVAPITAGRIKLPIDLSHWAPTSGALTFAIETSLADLAGVGTGGTGAAGVPYAVAIERDVLVPPHGRAPIRAVVTDAAGNVLDATGLAWSSSNAVDGPVTVTADPSVALVANPTPQFVGSVTITATLGALSDTATAFFVD